MVISQGNDPRLFTHIPYYPINRKYQFLRLQLIIDKNNFKDLMFGHEYANSQFSEEIFKINVGFVSCPLSETQC